MVVIINGAPGTGKSKVAEMLNLKTPQSAWIDGDWLLTVIPRKGTDEERRLRYKQIADVAKNYFENGYTMIFISFVYGPSTLPEQLELLSTIDQVKAISLITDSEILRKRHSNDPRKREEIESPIKLNEQIKQLNNTVFIDNTNLSIEQTVDAVTQKLSL